MTTESMLMRLRVMTHLHAVVYFIGSLHLVCRVMARMLRRDWGGLKYLPPGNLGNFGDSLAQVAIVQFDIDHDPIAFGDLLLQDVGVGYRYRPSLSSAGLECDRPLGLINTDDRS